MRATYQEDKGSDKKLSSLILDDHFLEARCPVLERLELGLHLELKVGLGLDKKDLVDVGYGCLLGSEAHIALRSHEKTISGR
jgi:hypothetical protein